MKTKSWILVFPLLTLTSCFEFVEEISFENEESGIYELTMNCSESRMRLKNIMKLDTFMGFNVPSQYQVENNVQKALEILSISKGITQASRTMDFDQFIFTVKFHFDSVKHLNNALNNLRKLEIIKTPLPYINLYQNTAGVFKRLEIPSDSLVPKSHLNRIGLFNGATVTTIYRFSQVVNSTSNSKSVISKNRKAVLLKQNFVDLAKNPSLISNTIQLK